MKLFLALALIVAVSAYEMVPELSREQHEDLFNKWIQQHSRFYHNAEERESRFQTWRVNLEMIRTHNAAGKSFTLAMNQFGDMEIEEYQEMMLGFHNFGNSAPQTHVPSENATLPATVDWRQKGVVTPIKNQGQCGSCWSFSTTGSVEGAHAISTGSLVSLSEQDLVDCSGSFGNQGCNGGLMTAAFEYIISKKGDDTESSYPYQGVQGSCQHTSSNIGASISSYANITQGSESNLQDAAANKGPVSVAIDANHNEFMFYSSGVLVVPGCSSTQLDHGVLVVGYGSSNGQDYWLVKNSWGTSWGMQGYVMMARNHNNMCGIATMASYPIV